jgi:arsenate reductase
MDVFLLEIARHIGDCREVLAAAVDRIRRSLAVCDYSRVLMAGTDARLAASRALLGRVDTDLPRMRCPRSDGAAFATPDLPVQHVIWQIAALATAGRGREKAMTVTIYHNPRCGKSRATLALLEGRGLRPHVVEYLKTPPDKPELRRLLRMLGLTPRQLLRKKEAAEAGLDEPGLSDEQLLDGMLEHPIVIERPIVVNGDRAALGRPPEAVLKIL